MQEQNSAYCQLGVFNMEEFLRNFCIISHIDHGKSTLADRFLELTKTVPKEKMRPQFLDSLALEKEKGITIKMQPVRMEYELDGQKFILNLIDTPGHIDFSYEVSRGLAAVEGAILLVDATKGIQAQSIYHYLEAKKQGVFILPVVNKIDLPQAQVEKTKRELKKLFNENEEILEISAKLGTNVEKLLRKIIEKIPPPKGDEKGVFRALIFDSQYHPHKGVIAFVRVIDGKISSKEKIYLLKKKIEGKIKDLGYFTPEMKSSFELKRGEIGYIATGIKDPKKVRVGETITLFEQKDNPKVQALAGYQEPKPVVFASIFPQESSHFPKLEKAISELNLTDPAFSFQKERKSILGQGFQCSFLGSLHCEIVIERLKREYGLDLIVSKPQVVYKMRDKKGKEKFIFSPDQFPQNLKEVKILERWVQLQILTPPEFLGPLFKLLKNLQGEYLETKYLDQRIILIYKAPLRKIIGSFYDKLKSVSQGFASLNYELAEWREGDFVKLEILIGGKKEEIFSQIVPKKDAFFEGKKMVKKLKEILPPQQFPLALQAAIGGKIIARETKKALRKDVLAHLYGGDYTRKRKLLEKQKKGKKKLKQKAQVHFPPEIYLSFFKES